MKVLGCSLDIVASGEIQVANTIYGEVALISSIAVSAIVNGLQNPSAQAKELMRLIDLFTHHATGRGFCRSVLRDLTWELTKLLRPNRRDRVRRAWMTYALSKVGNG